MAPFLLLYVRCIMNQVMTTPKLTQINTTSIDEKYDTLNDFYNTSYGVINLPEVPALSRRERGFLDLAVKMAESSDVDNRHGAVVVQGGRVLALGVNKWRNRDMRWDNEKDTFKPILTVHAEMDALSRVDNPKGSVLYIARVNERGEERMSRPCRHCMKELVKLGVKRVIYTVS